MFTRRTILASTLFATLAVAGTLHAGDLYWISGGASPAVTRFDVTSTSIVSTKPITSLKPGEEVVGVSAPIAVKPYMYGSDPKDRLLLLTQDPDSFVHRRPSLTLSTGVAGNAGFLKENQVFIDGAGYALHGSDTLLPWPGTTPIPTYNVIVDKDGTFYKPGGLAGSSSAPETSIIKTLPFPGQVIGVGRNPKGRILVLTGGSTPQLHTISFSYAPGPKLPLTKIASFAVTYPGQSTPGAQILGFAMAPNKDVYALVNKVGSWIGHGWGDIVLCKGTIVAGKLDFAEVAQISSWFNGGVGALSFPPHHMVFGL